MMAAAFGADRTATTLDALSGGPASECSTKLLSDADSSPVNDRLELVLANAVPAAVDIEALWKCLEELARCLAPLGRAWRLSPFGSVRNMFLTRGSDIDVTIYRVDARSEGDHAAAASTLEYRVLPLLSKSEKFEVVRLVTGARVPVLSLRFDGKVDLDLTSHNTEPLRNTQLLRAYAEAGPVARGLVLLVKLWSKAAGVCGAQSGNLASYSLALMALYFLQVHPAFQLPCLPSPLFDGTGPAPEAARVRWECSASLSQALLRFFAFYSWEFLWGTEVVSVRLGRRCPVSSPEFARLSNSGCNRLHVEDPFLIARNLNCVLGPTQEVRLQGAMRAAEAALKSGCLPVGLDVDKQG